MLRNYDGEKIALKVVKFTRTKHGANNLCKKLESARISKEIKEETIERIKNKGIKEFMGL